MKTLPKCLSCIVDDLCGALESEVKEEETKFEIENQALNWLSKNYGPEKIPSYYITQVHRILKEESGIETPFKERREKSNQVVETVVKRQREEIEDIENDYERFHHLIKWVIAGNHLDFRTVGTGYGFPVEEIENMMKEVVNEGLHIDESKKIYERLKNSDEVLYLFDNVGEIVLDKLMIEEITKHGVKVTSAAKSGPITSDATIQNAKEIGVNEVSNLISTGKDTLGLDIYDMSKEVEEALDRADLTISKGQANFYALSEIRDSIESEIACLFKTKCDPVSKKFGLEGSVNIAKILE